tara:strand:- start:1094 stop:1633 length:540 start_codon:yes stop_codon:yes gene_type:complete
MVGADVASYKTHSDYDMGGKATGMALIYYNTFNVNEYNTLYFMIYWEKERDAILGGLVTEVVFLWNQELDGNSKVDDIDFRDALIIPVYEAGEDTKEGFFQLLNWISDKSFPLSGVINIGLQGFPVKSSLRNNGLGYRLDLAPWSAKSDENGVHTRRYEDGEWVQEVIRARDFFRSKSL